MKDYQFFLIHFWGIRIEIDNVRKGLMLSQTQGDYLDKLLLNKNVYQDVYSFTVFYIFQFLILIEFFYSVFDQNE